MCPQLLKKWCFRQVHGRLHFLGCRSHVLEGELAYGSPQSVAHDAEHIGAEVVRERNGVAIQPQVPDAWKVRQWGQLCQLTEQVVGQIQNFQRE